MPEDNIVQYQQPMYTDQPYPSPLGYPNMYLPPDERTLVSQTDPSKLMGEIEHVLKGEVQESNKDGEKIWIKRFKAMINDDGIQSLLADLRPLLSQNTTLSNLEDEEVRNLTIEAGKIVVLKLAVKYKEFAVDKSNLSTIVLSITNPMFIALKRGFKEGERKFIKTTVRSTEQINVSPQPPKENKLFGLFK